MTWTFQTTLDFLGPLAVLVGLCYVYGYGRRALPGIGPDAMGLLFGCVAALQMHMPFEPVPGLIIDMRNFPVALAGAFLGVRGLSFCLIVACVARFYLGGVGMGAGVIAILLAGAAGVVWAQIANAVQGAGRRSVPMLLALGPLMSVHMAAVIVLPADLAMWFLREAAPVILVLNLFVLPVAAWLMDREAARQRKVTQQALPLAQEDGATLGTARDLSHALTLAMDAPRYAGGAYAMAIRPRKRLLAIGHVGRPSKHLLCQINGHLKNVLPAETILSTVLDGTVVAVLPATEVPDKDQLWLEIRDIAHLGDASLKIKVSEQIFPHVPTLPEVLLSLRILSTANARKMFPHGWDAADRRSNTGASRLFDIAEDMMYGARLDKS
ncbi:MAG: LytS/YhcK type 5TM receptor domain-containing protein, partial [Pseudomonadota bacterium]